MLLKSCPEMSELIFVLYKDTWCLIFIPHSVSSAGLFSVKDCNAGQHSGLNIFELVEPFKSSVNEGIIF